MQAHEAALRLPGPAREPVVVPGAGRARRRVRARRAGRLEVHGWPGPLREAPARRGRDRAPRPAHRALPDPAGTARWLSARGASGDGGRGRLRPRGARLRRGLRAQPVRPALPPRRSRSGCARLFAPGARVARPRLRHRRGRALPGRRGRARARDRRRRRRWSSGAREKAERAGVAERVHGFDVLAAEGVASLGRRASTAPTRTSARSTARRSAGGRGPARALRPGAPLLVCRDRAAGRCPRSSGARSSRRARSARPVPEVAGVPVPVRHLTPGALREALGPAFAWTRRAAALGVLVPGPTHEALGAAPPAGVRRCWPRWSALVRRWPVLRGARRPRVVEGCARDDARSRAAAPAAPAGAGGRRPLRPALRALPDLAGQRRARADARGAPARGGRGARARALGGAAHGRRAAPLRRPLARRRAAARGRRAPDAGHERHAARAVRGRGRAPVRRGLREPGRRVGRRRTTRLRGVPAWDARGRGRRARCGRRAAPARSSRGRSLHAGTSTSSWRSIAAARSLGFDHVSFLPLDAASDAFGGAAGARAPSSCRRPRRSPASRRRSRALARGALADGFVLERPDEAARASRGTCARAPARSPFERPAVRRALVVASSSRPTARCGRASSSPRSATRATGSRALRAAAAYREALRADPPAERRPARAASARSGGGGFLGVLAREADRSSSTTRAARATSCRSPSSTSARCCPDREVVIVDGRARAGARAHVARAGAATRCAWASPC